MHVSIGRQSSRKKMKALVKESNDKITMETFSGIMDHAMDDHVTSNIILEGEASGTKEKNSPRGTRRPLNDKFLIN